MPGGEFFWVRSPYLLNFVTNTLLFGVIYKVLPKARVPWRHAFAGGLLVSLVSLAWIFGQHLLVRFLIGSSYTAYGLVGSFIAVMIWAYYISAVLFLGAEFVQACWGRRGTARGRRSHSSRSCSYSTYSIEASRRRTPEWNSTAA